MKPYQCEAGAWYENGRMKRACFEPAEYQIIYDNELLLQVVCTEHAKTSDMVSFDKTTIEPWTLDET